MGAAAAVVGLLAAGTAALPQWLVEARNCVVLVERQGGVGDRVTALAAVAEAEKRLQATRPPSESELRSALEPLDSPDRPAALAAMALHSVTPDGLVSLVALRYRRADPFPDRYYGAKVLASMTRQQVAHNAAQLARAAREEEGTFALAVLSQAIRKMDPAPMVELLADLAVAGSPVLAFLTARDVGDGSVRDLKTALERRGAVCPLYAIRDVEFTMSQKGWPVEHLERPKDCRTQ